MIHVPVTLALAVALFVGLVLLPFGKTANRVGLFILAFAGSSTVFLLWTDYRWQHGYPQIDVGSSQTRVRSLMGRPTKTKDCTTTIYGYERGEFDPAAPGCVEEYWYYCFDGLEAWELSFDPKKEVIYKYHWVSP